MTQFNNPPNSDSIYSDHLINQIHANLDLLLQKCKISQNSINIIKEVLPPTSHHLDSAPREPSMAINQLPSSQPSPSVQNIYPQPHHQPPSFPVSSSLSNQTPSPHLKQARALWPYRGFTADDLSFEKGDIIVILLEENQDWWRGQIQNSQKPAGIFPSNHVEVISLPSQSDGPPKLPYPSHQSVGSFLPPTSQAPPQWQQTPGYNQPPQYLDSKAPQQAPPPSMQHTQIAPAPVNITVEKPKKNMLQGRFGQALAGGAGFGAGSAVASHLVNAIL